MRRRPREDRAERDAGLEILVRARIELGDIIVGRLKRLPMFLKLISLLPEPPRPSPKRPWSAVIRLERS